MMKRRDDVESVGNDSAMSTSSNLDPFAKDDLGKVVHEASFAIGEKGADA